MSPEFSFPTVMYGMVSSPLPRLDAKNWGMLLWESSTWPEFSINELPLLHLSGHLLTGLNSGNRLRQSRLGKFSVGGGSVNMRWTRTNTRARVAGLTVLTFGVAFGGASILHLSHFPTVMGASSSEAVPKLKFDPDWPKPLPNKWKIGGIMGLTVDKDDNVWAYDRANDLTDIELEAESNPPIADCCKRPPSLIHFDKAGNVIGYIDPQQGHGLAVDLKGFLY